MSLTLANAIGTTDTVLTVVGTITDASGPGIITIESEQIFYTGNSVNQFVDLTRGYNSTTAATHAKGTVLTFVENEPVGVGDLNGTLPLVVSGGTGVLVSGSATVSLPASTDSVNGYLTSADHVKITGAVQNTRTVNGHALSSNVTVTASDAGALPITGGTVTGDVAISHPAADSLLTMGSGTNPPTIKGDTSSDLIITLNKSGSIFAINPSTSGGPTWLQANGSLTVNTNSAVASAALVVGGTTRGFLAPVMTNVQRDAISSPAEGIQIYSLDDHAIEFYNGTTWKQVATV